MGKIFKCLNVNEDLFCDPPINLVVHGRADKHTEFIGQPSQQQNIQEKNKQCRREKVPRFVNCQQANNIVFLRF